MELPLLLGLHCGSRSCHMAWLQVSDIIIFSLSLHPGHSTGFLLLLLPPLSPFCSIQCLSSPQYSCLQNPMNRGPWWAAIYGVDKVRHDWSDLAAAAATHASKLMLKILQARLQLYVNHKLPDVQAGFRKGRGTKDQIANICWVIK